MANNGTNGHTPPQIVAAQKELERLAVPLSKLNEQIAAAQLKLTAAERAAAEADRAQQAAERAFADDTDNAAARTKFKQANEEIPLTRAVVKRRRQELAELEAKRPELQARVDAAAVALTRMQRECRKEQIEQEQQSARFKLAQHQQAVMEWQRRINVLADEKLQIVREEAAERDQAHTESRAKFLRDNGPVPGLERVRH